MIVKDYTFSLDRIVLTIIIFFSIIPDVGLKFSTMGFYWTAYRLSMFLCFFLILFYRNGDIYIPKSTFTGKWTIFMMVWLVYGLIFMVISKYSDFHSGLLELLSIFNGLLLFIILGNITIKTEDIDYIEKLIYFLLCVNIVIALLEIILGIHLPTSAFNDIKSSMYHYTSARFATGFMYNMNDFSAMITCLSPVLLNRNLGKKRIVTLGLIFIINHINDANICNLSILLFGLFYCLLLQNTSSRHSDVKRILIIIVIVAGIGMVTAMGMGVISNNTGMMGKVFNQINNYSNGNGSLHSRVSIYREAILAFLKSGALGIGPSGFSNYAIRNSIKADLVNPHSLFLEIATQYGLLLFSFFIYMIGKLFVSAYHSYNSVATEEKKEYFLMIIAFILIYCIASFAPSAFLGYSYQWLVIALMCLKLDDFNKYWRFGQ